jgi:hypothetical protein
MPRLIILLLFYVHLKKYEIDTYKTQKIVKFSTVLDSNVKNLLREKN